MKFLSNLSFILDKICGVLIAIMLGLMVIFTIAQVVCRTWFTSLSWSEEATRFLLIWSTFLGAACVYRHNGNIAITIIQNLFPESVQKFLRIIVHVVCLILFCVLCYYGFLYCGRQVRTAAAIPVKMKYIYSCLPISMIILAVHSMAMLFEEVKPLCQQADISPNLGETKDYELAAPSKVKMSETDREVQ